MGLLHHTKRLQQEVTSDGDEKDRQAEIAQDDLSDEGWFPHLAKFVLFGALILLNIRLFVKTIPGLFGVIVAGAAVMSGCFAIYCWNRVDKSNGAHLWTMRLGAAFFTLLELVHATASVWEMVLGFNDGQRAWSEWYSHKVAFPLMAVSIVIGFASHRYTHWRAKINQARAKSQIAIATEKAQLDTQLHRMAMEEKLASATLGYVERMTITERDTIRAVKQLQAVRQEAAELDEVDDPVIKRMFEQRVTPVAKKSGYVNGELKN